MSDSHECLSFADAIFLYVEQAGAPVNVASVSAFEGTITLEECMEYVDSKLALIPRFLQRVVPSPFGLGSPTWQHDLQFDIRNHVRAISLKRGTDAEWKAAVSRVLSQNFDRSRPLWDITLLHGLKGERTGVIVRCHHCLVDGVAGIGLLKVLLDESPISAPLRRKKRRVAVRPKQELGAAMLDGLASSCFSSAQALLSAYLKMLQMAQQASSSGGKQGQASAMGMASGPLGWVAPLGNLAQLLSELAQPTEKLPFNVLCRGPQKFDWVEIPMAEVAAVKDERDCTVNEVILATLTVALRHYAELHNVEAKGRKLRIVVPVNVRANGEAAGVGNHITFLPVDIPMGITEPRRLLSEVQKRVGFSRTAHGAELVALAAILLEALPPPLQSLVGGVLSKLPISVCNSICTNVHGPSTPLYLLGHKLLSTYPYVPIGGEMGMNCAVMSYNGNLFVGFTGDAQAIPDLSRLASFFTAGFAEIRDAVGVKAVKRERPPVKRAQKKMTEEPVSDGFVEDSQPAAVAVA